MLTWSALASAEAIRQPPRLLYPKFAVGLAMAKKSRKKPKPQGPAKAANSTS